MWPTKGVNIYINNKTAGEVENPTDNKTVEMPSTYRVFR